MKKRSEKSERNGDKGSGPNPSGAARQLLSDYLELGSDYVFEPLRTGVFCTTFNPIEFERFATVLYSEVGVRCDTYPDIRIYNPEMESKLERTPVLPFQNGELCKSGAVS